MRSEKWSVGEACFQRHAFSEREQWDCSLPGRAAESEEFQTPGIRYSASRASLSFLGTLKALSEFLCFALSSVSK